MKYLCRKNLYPCIRVLLPKPNPFPRCFRLRPQLVKGIVERLNLQRDFGVGLLLLPVDVVLVVENLF